MRIEFQQEGGFAAFPGLSRPFVVESKTLDADQNRNLRTLLADSDFFQLPAKAAPSPGAADLRRYTITVVDGRRRHTAQFTDPIENQRVQDLIDFLNGMRRNPPQQNPA